MQIMWGKSGGNEMFGIIKLWIFLLEILCPFKLIFLPQYTQPYCDQRPVPTGLFLETDAEISGGQRGYLHHSSNCDIDGPEDQRRCGDHVHCQEKRNSLKTKLSLLRIHVIY